MLWLSSVLQVEYPFHDEPDECVSPKLVRRARVKEGDEWCIIKPNQKWADGKASLAPQAFA